MNGNNQKPDKWWIVALSGFFGAVGPSIAQLIAMTQQEPFEMPHFSFFFGMFLIGILGVGLVLVAKEKVAWKAFTQGLATPSFFSSAGTVAVSVACLMGSADFMSAYAAPPAPEELDPQDSTYLIIETQDSVEVVAGDRIYFIQSRSTLHVPQGQVVRVDSKDLTREYRVTGDTAYIKIRVNKQKAKGSFLKGILPLMNQ